MDLSGIHGTLPEVEDESPKKVCAVCQAPSDKSCGACHQIHYCSADHQKSHWKEHKKDCPPIKIVNSPELGPHFVATRDLPPWSLLLTELPVLIAPHEIVKDPPSCISCSSILPESGPWSCFQCSTPFFCNLSCSMNKIHSEFECDVLSKCNTQQRTIYCMPPNLAYLRAMGLKNKDPQTWRKVINLRGADQYKPGDANENDKWFIQEILPLVGEKGVGFEADMAKLRGIIQQKTIVNHPNGINVPKWDHCESQLLYLEASNFAQNCFPNCTPIIGKGPQFQLQVRSTVGIKKGTITSIDYEGLSHEWGAMVRQHEIDGFGGALCICSRCSDPTELGTMISAFKCREQNCMDGYLLPVDPMDMAQNALWRCNLSECNGKGSTWVERNDIHKGLHNRATSFLASVSLGDVERMIEFFASFKKKLHPNHWLILLFKKATIDKLISDLDMKKITLSIPATLFYISLIEDLLKMTEFTSPGLSIARGHLWTRILCILMAKLTAVKLGSDSCPKGLENEFKRRTIEVIDQLDSIAKFYPEIWPKESFKLCTEIIRPEFQLQLQS